MEEPQRSRTHSRSDTAIRSYSQPSPEVQQQHRSVERRRNCASADLNNHVTEYMNDNDNITTVTGNSRSNALTKTATAKVVATSATSTTIDPKKSSQQNHNNTTTDFVIPDVILQLPKEVRNIIAGGIAGMIAKSVVAPVDRIKILYQISAVPFHLRDVPKVAYNIIQQEGMIALWKGNMATMIRVFPYSGIQFMTFEFCKSYFLEKKNQHSNNDMSLPSLSTTNHSRIPSPVDPVIDSSASSSMPDTTATTTTTNSGHSTFESNRHDRKYGLSPMESLVSGMIAGTVSVICTYPLDLVRAQLAVLKRCKGTTIIMNQQSQPQHPINPLSSTPKPSTPITTIPPNHGFVRVLRDNYIRGGFSGLFRGITPTLFGILPYSGIAFTLNEQGKREIQHYMGRDVTTMERLQCGAFSGLIAQTITYPIEVTRRRMQTIGLVNKNDTALSTCLGDNKGMTNGTTSTLNVMKSSTTTTATILSSPQSPPTLYTTVTQLYEEQGVRGFLKGVSMNWMKGPIAFAISFTTFDYVKLILEHPSERRQ